MKWLSIIQFGFMVLFVKGKWVFFSFFPQEIINSGCVLYVVSRGTYIAEIRSKLWLVNGAEKTKITVFGLRGN